MSQEEVYQILKKNKTKWFSGKELMELMGTSKGTAIRNARKLYEYGEANLKIETYFGRSFYLFQYKGIKKVS